MQTNNLVKTVRNLDHYNIADVVSSVLGPKNYLNLYINVSLNDEEDI